MKVKVNFEKLMKQVNKKYIKQEVYDFYLKRHGNKEYLLNENDWVNTCGDKCYLVGGSYFPITELTII